MLVSEYVWSMICSIMSEILRTVGKGVNRCSLAIILIRLTPMPGIGHNEG